TPGLSIGRAEAKMGLRGSSTVSLSFEECELGSDALLGREGEGFKIAMMALDGGRIGIASQAVGIGRAALEQSCTYAKERHQFGRRLAEHQAIELMIADGAVALEAARWLTLRAAWRKERAQPFTREAAMAKL